MAMKNLALINAIGITPYAAEPLEGTSSALEKSIAFSRTLPGAAATAVLCRKKEAAFTDCQVVARDGWTVADLFREMNRLKSGYDHIFYFHADCPFLDQGLAARMFENHISYFADYTFADGYPHGLAVEILKAGVLEPLAGLVKETDVLNREAIFEVVKKDINAFDLETEIAPLDLRQLRLSLTADTRRNFLLCQEVAAAGGRDEKSILDVIVKKPEILRTLPAYFNLQIVEGCPQACAYCAYPAFHGDVLGKKAEMALADLEKIVAGIRDFCGDATLSLSLWGEPALHSRIDEIIRASLAAEGLSLVIETSGIGWNAAGLTALAESLPRPPVWIVSLDALTEDEYMKLRGPGFKEAVDTARLLLRLFPGRTYVQAVRMKENEASLERFYREWRKETESIIIQKYDRFGDLLPDRQVTDLAPLKRLPCWHVKRDLAVLLDGTVPLCREDVKRGRILGNLLKEPLEAVWRRGEAVYREHLAEAYPPLCKGCDEYYTFNF